MLKKATLILAVIAATGCGTQAPTPNAPATQAAAEPPARSVNAHIVVTMPPGWTPVDLSRVPRGSFATSLNEELGARILVTQGRVVGTAKEEAAVLAEMLRHDGFVSAPVQESADKNVATFTVSRPGMRGKIAVRHFAGKAARIVVLGQWPTDSEADEGGRKAVDAVVASAEYK